VETTQLHQWADPMRYFLLASVVVVFASTATDLKAQYPQAQV
jgi:hypothetical protein